MKSANYRHWFEEEITVEITPLGAISTPAVALVETEPLVTARQLLVDQRVPAIVVVDDTGSLRGVLTRTDVLRVLAKSPEARVGDAMSGFVLALSRYARVEQAAALMAHEQVGQVVVVGEGGELYGMVSAVDIARVLAVRAGWLAA